VRWSVLFALALVASGHAVAHGAAAPVSAERVVAPATPANRATAASVLGAAVRHDRRAREQARDRPLFIGVSIIVLVGVAKVWLRRRLARRHVVSLDLTMIAIGFVLLLMMRLPLRAPAGWIGTLLFVGLAVLYRLLGHFEEPAEREPS
jgi:hypothetical protein